jgi:hypothetical protein
MGHCSYFKRKVDYDRSFCIAAFIFKIYINCAIIISGKYSIEIFSWTGILIPVGNCFCINDFYESRKAQFKQRILPLSSDGVYLIANNSYLTRF